MSVTGSIWLVIILGLLAANAPFITNKLFGVVSLSKNKSLFVRLLELFGFYALVGAVAMFLEKNAGQITSQGWEFFAISVAVFVTFAFPGFVYCYLLERK